MSELSGTPSMNPMFRFQWEEAQQTFVLLYPEGMIKLNGGAGEILSLVDGERNVEAIVAELQHKFPDADGIDKDIQEFLADAIENRWIQF